MAALFPVHLCGEGFNATVIANKVEVGARMNSGTHGQTDAKNDNTGMLKPISGKMM